MWMKDEVGLKYIFDRNRIWWMTCGLMCALNIQRPEEFKPSTRLRSALFLPFKTKIMVLFSTR
jgi:hypothetical protein